MEQFIKVENLSRKYTIGDEQILAINNISFEINEGEFAVILGPSGSGKSTLLNLFGGMDRATSGTIIVNNINITNFSDRQLNDYRRKEVGFVFQFYNLLPNLTASENIEIARKLSDNPLETDALKLVGLSHRAKHFPAELSGGEQQRVSIARALAKKPKILLCDEPTGALDSETGKIVLVTLYKMCKENNQSVIVVTHNSVIAEAADRVIHLRNGQVSGIECNGTPIPMEGVAW
jgi:putative ABC transport system ATP-binding protein